MTEENKDNQNLPKAPATPKANEAAKQNPPAPPKIEKPKCVEVICEGTLGHLLLKKAAITDDEDYVALLKTNRGASLVREVK